MKRIIQVFFLLLLAIMIGQANGQVVNEKAKKKISIGVGMYTDILMKFPDGVKPRTINQGLTVFGTYNVPFGKSNFGFAIGLGLSSHNIYGNYVINRNTDSTWLMKIPDSVSYTKSKINCVYLEAPLEFRFKSKSKISVGIGFKVGFLVGSSYKYVGTGEITTNQYTLTSGEKTRVKFLGVKDLESFTYGPTFRIGYKWFNVYSSYMLSSIFKKGKGPEVVPLSVGFVLMPF